MFTRLFTSILDSSINMESVPPSARWLWITMLLIADDERTGIVDMPVERLAARAGLTKAQTREALNILSAPDPDSTSPDEDGRRLVPIREDSSRGWRLVNYEKYKQIANEEHKREQSRLRSQAYRERAVSSNGERPSDDSGSTISASGIPTHAPTPDFAAIGLLKAKIGGCGLRDEVPEQLIVAWESRFGSELIIETIHDCASDLTGKHFRYLERILTVRMDDPSQRPQNRKKRAQAHDNKDANGGMVGPDGIYIPHREGDYWGGN